MKTKVKDAFLMPSGNEGGDAMNTMEVLTLLLVIFTALMYLDNKKK